jgi:hypothetical protein
MPFRVLSIDGGGIRGIIPALILAELEQRAERPIAKIFDLVAGTSTGGILAVGLTMAGARRKPKYSARDLVALYEEEGDDIFHRSKWHQIRAVGSLAEEKYPSGGIERVLGERFAEAWLSESLTNVLVTAYDIELRRPHFFKSDRARLRGDVRVPIGVEERHTLLAARDQDRLRGEPLAQGEPGLGQVGLAADALPPRLGRLAHVRGDDRDALGARELLFLGVDGGGNAAA